MSWKLKLTGLALGVGGVGREGTGTALQRPPTLARGFPSLAAPGVTAQALKTPEVLAPLQAN